MERRSARRRIIDSTSVPSCRRRERQQSLDVADAECGPTSSDDTSDNGKSRRDNQEISQVNTENVNEEVMCDGANCVITTGSQPVLQIDNIQCQTASEGISCMTYSEHSEHGEPKRQTNDININDILETKLQNELAVYGIEHESGQAKRRLASLRFKPWMLPTRNIEHQSLYPAEPEETYQEPIARDFMLPWRSVDLDDTYRIRKPVCRRSSENKLNSHLKKQQSIDNLSTRKDNNTYIFSNEHDTDNFERKESLKLGLAESQLDGAYSYRKCNFMRTNVKKGLETKDPYSVELEKTRTSVETDTEAYYSDVLDDLIGSFETTGTEDPLLDTVSITFDLAQESQVSCEEEAEEAYSNLMADEDGTPRLLTVEEKWQIIFNEKTRAPIFAVAQYVDYLGQYVAGKGVAKEKEGGATRDKERISPMSYLLRKLKLDLKMSYDSFVEEFLKPGNNGMALLVKLLKFIQNTGTQQSGSANKMQLKNYKKTLTDEHDCLLCIKFALRIKTGLMNLLEANYGLETIAMSLLSSFTKSRGTAIEILTIALAAAEGFSRTLDSFTYIQLKIGEPVRFKSLMNMMNMESQHNTIFKVSCMKFMNCLLDAATNLNVRVYLQHELETAGLEVSHIEQKTTGTGLEYDELRYELSEWNRKYIRVDDILSQKNLLAQRADGSQQEKIEELQRKVKMLTLEKTTIEHQLKTTRDHLQQSNEDLQKRQPTEHKETQMPESSFTYRDVACQCSQQTRRETSKNPLFDAQLTNAWQQTSSPLPPNGGAEEKIDLKPEDDELDEHGVVKVQQWLNSQSDVDDDTIDDTIDATDGYSNDKRKSVDSIVRKAEFPGNWRLVPKTLAPFPSRFPTHRCHKTNCDRCDIRNRPENLPVKQKQEVVVQTVAAELEQEEVIIARTRLDVKSESSDSAIGGSGERWQTNENRVSLLPAEVTEAEILQDMIEPDDSASGCRSNEPFPDYSVISTRHRPQKSLCSELSEVLREFEGNLNEYESQESFSNFNNLYTGHFVNLGQI